MSLDCALWELQANQEQRPVWQIANLPQPKSLQTTLTLSAESPKSWRMPRASSRGFMRSS